MRIKVIACEVMFREICLCAAHSPHTVDLDFLKRGLHDNAETLRETVQHSIDAAEEGPPSSGMGSANPGGYDAIVLGYGLCSNGVLGLVARETPVVIPRAHDCITFFLGSKDVYQRYFNDEPGTYWFTSGWIERAGSHVPRTKEAGEGMQLSYDDLVAKYGEDNAAYLCEVQQAWIKHYSRAALIDLKLGPHDVLRAEVEQIAAERDWDFDDLPGDLRLIRKMLDGEWNADEFLIVQPGQQVIRGNDDDIIAAAGLSPESLAEHADSAGTS
ncbi:MAG: DUF1638 domain-containing protein [Armatimonadota bacterium]|nr:MAG: DUF1638 domain-containing protein [Armatimonadota bacterium]